MKIWINREAIKSNLNFTLYKDINASTDASIPTNIVNATNSGADTCGNVRYSSMDLFSDANFTNKIGIGFEVQNQYVFNTLLFTKSEYSFNLFDANNINESTINSKKINFTLNINNYNNTNTSSFQDGTYISDFVEQTLKRPKNGYVKCTYSSNPKTLCVKVIYK